MLVKTFGKAVRFVFVLATFGLAAMNLWCNGPGGGGMDARERPRVTVSVYNDAEVPVDVLGRAEVQAGQVFRHAGIEVAWLNCKIPAASEEASQACREAVFPEHLHLRIVQQSLGLNQETMGISFQAGDGSGCYADLFYQPMVKLHNSDGADIASLLGHAAAHEIGHLLLGNHSHSTAGIMHAHWSAQELVGGKRGGLVFSEQESLRMKAKLATALQSLREGLVSGAGSVPVSILD